MGSIGRTLTIVFVMLQAAGPLMGQVCEGGTMPERMAVEAIVTDEFSNPGLEGRLVFRDLYAGMGVRRGLGFGRFESGSDLRGSYFGQVEAKPIEVALTVGGQRNLGALEACVSTEGSYGSLGSATEYRYYVDSFGRVIDVQEKSDLPNPDAEVFTMRASLAVGGAPFPGWTISAALFGQWYDIGEFDPVWEDVRQLGVRAGLSWLAVDGLQLRAEYSDAVWDSRDPNETLSWFVLGVGWIN